MTLVIHGPPAVGKLNASPDDDAFLQRVIDVVERHGGELAFVRLSCDPVTNEQRVAADDRREFGKITSVESLRKMVARWNCGAAIPFRESLEIDNSALGADAVARRIAIHFRLPMRP